MVHIKSNVFQENEHGRDAIIGYIIEDAVENQVFIPRKFAGLMYESEPTIREGITQQGSLGNDTLWYNKDKGKHIEKCYSTLDAMESSVDNTKVLSMFVNSECRNEFLSVIGSKNARSYRLREFFKRVQSNYSDISGHDNIKVFIGIEMLRALEYIPYKEIRTEYRLGKTRKSGIVDIVVGSYPSDGDKDRIDIAIEVKDDKLKDSYLEELELYGKQVPGFGTPKRVLICKDTIHICTGYNTEYKSFSLEDLANDTGCSELYDMLGKFSWERY